jgi:hypothetical protein
MFRRWIFVVFLLSLRVQTQEPQFLPEIDRHLTINASFQAYLQAKDDREGGDPEQLTFGPSIRYFRMPLIKLKHVTLLIWTTPNHDHLSSRADTVYGQETQSAEELFRPALHLYFSLEPNSGHRLRPKSKAPMVTGVWQDLFRESLVMDPTRSS